MTQYLTEFDRVAALTELGGKMETDQRQLQQQQQPQQVPEQQQHPQQQTQQQTPSETPENKENVGGILGELHTILGVLYHFLKDQ